MKRAVKHFITIILVISLICCSSLLVFAYHPVVSIQSSDWMIDTEFTYKAVYPNKIDSNYAPNDKVYQHSSLNGETYFGSRDERDGNVVYKATVTLPNPFEIIKGSDVGDVCIIVRNGDTYFFFSGCSYCHFIMFGNDLYQWCEDFSHTCITSYCDYPYSDWYSEESFLYQVGHAYSWEHEDFTSVSDCGWYDFDNNYDTEIVYCNIDVSSYEYYIENVGWSNQTVRPADSVSSASTLDLSVYLEKPLTLYYGTVTFELDASDVEKICFGSYAWLFKNFGFIVGYDIEYLTFAYTLTIRSDSSNVAKTQLFNYKYNTFINDVSLDVGDACIFNHFDISDFEFDLSNTPLTFEFAYTFVSDGFNLYFPGSIEIVEFASYEDDMEHNEVLSAVQDASNSITGSIGNAQDAITSSIGNAALNINSTLNENTASINNQISSSAAQLSTEIQDCLNSNFNSLVTPGVSVPDTGVDTSDLDDVMSKQDALLDDIYKGLDSKQQQYLNDMGYSSVDKFFEDKINSLNNASMQSSFDYVKGLFENVLSVTGISSLLYFSLIFGFGMFLIGRRVS